MRIQFVLPEYHTHPIGGYKIILEYAARLAQRGHRTTVYMPLRAGWGTGWRGRAKAVYCTVRDATRPWEIQLGWFAGLGVKIIPTLDSRRFEDGDVIVATGYKTAATVAAAPASKGRKFQLVHDYEYWRSAKGAELAAIEAAFRQPGICHLSTSPAVRDMIVQLSGREPLSLPDAIDLNVYQCQRDVDDPNRCWIGFPNRGEPFKRTWDAIEACVLLRRERPDLRFWSFGGARPTMFPDWIEHHPSASDAALVELYNRTAVFLVPSEYEGWGLPGSEAMACGAALVSVDCGGVRGYATDGQNALLTKARDPVGLAAAAARLLDDPAQRLRLARAGVASMKEFGWPEAVDRLERHLASGGCGNNTGA